MGQQTRSEDAVEQRRIFARSLHQDNLKTREKTAWETVVEFWNSCPLGHPDDRVGDCKSARITGSTFLRLVSELEMDGEVIVAVTFYGVRKFFFCVLVHLRIYSRHFLPMGCGSNHLLCLATLPS